MEEYFWKVIEKALIPIASHIKHGLNMNGFGNALNIIDIDDADLEAIEESIRERTFEYLTKKGSESAGDGYDGLVTTEMLHEYFGEAYKFAPEKFKFMPGDRKTIRKVAEHVRKVIDDLGESKGYKHFALKRKLACKTYPSALKVSKIHDKNSASDSNDKHEEVPTKSLQEMQADLFNKIIECLKQHKVDQIIDMNTIEQNMVSVVTENEQIVGYVCCIICKNNPSKKKSQPKRIQYYTNIHTPYWVTSNFASHLKGVHKLSAEKRRSKPNNTVKTIETPSGSTDTPETTVNLSVEIVSVDEAALTHINIDRNEFYRQISTQINKMCEAVLKYNEKPSAMNTLLPRIDAAYEIIVVKAEGDGNCLFRSLAHQLFGHKMKSNDMKKAHKTLRAEVVAYINANMLEFEHELKGRVYQIIEEADNSGDSDSDSNSYDMDEEIKNFMRQLSTNGYYGGSETLKAVSNLYKVNIIIFNEDEKFQIITKFGVTYEQTIGVAYRVNGLGERDHYDSVTDITSDNIWALVNCMIAD